MRKHIALLLGLGILTVSVIPIVVSGQAVETAECCRLSRDIQVKNVVVGGDVTGHPNCTDSDGAAADCAPCNSMKFLKNKVIGAGDCKGAESKCTLKGVEGITIDYESPDWGMICMLNTVYTVTDWLFFFFFAIVVIMGVIAGYMFLTAGGDATKIEKARNLVMYIVIGIIVALIVKVVPALVRTIVGV